MIQTRPIGIVIDVNDTGLQTACEKTINTLQHYFGKDNIVKTSSLTDNTLFFVSDHDFDIKPNVVCINGTDNLDLQLYCKVWDYFYSTNSHFHKNCERYLSENCYNAEQKSRSDLGSITGTTYR